MDQISYEDGSSGLIPRASTELLMPKALSGCVDINSFRLGYRYQLNI